MAKKKKKTEEYPEPVTNCGLKEILKEAGYSGEAEYSGKNGKTG